MIFVIWKDFDSLRADSIEEKCAAEELIASLLSRNGDYGTEILAVIDGKRVECEIVEKVKSVRLKL
jgi:hypothetical protein